MNVQKFSTLRVKWFVRGKQINSINENDERNKISSLLAHLSVYLMQYFIAKGCDVGNKSLFISYRWCSTLATVACHDTVSAK